MLKKTMTGIGLTCFRQFCINSFRPLMAVAILHRQNFLANPLTSSSNNFLPEKMCFYKYSTSATVLPSNYEEVKDLPNNPEKLLIDVREPAELKEFGKIPTSINIPLGIVAQELAANIRDEVFKTKYGREKPKESTEIIFHCRSGKRSGMAAETAIQLGYKNVRNYEGSWIDWAEHEGLPK